VRKTGVRSRELRSRKKSLKASASRPLRFRLHVSALLVRKTGVRSRELRSREDP